MPNLDLLDHDALLATSYHIEIDGLQLLLAGSMATDDPEGFHYWELTEAARADDPDIHLVSNIQQVGSIQINAFQRGADVVIQKSLREGFGLTVAEALWPDRLVSPGTLHSVTSIARRCLGSASPGGPHLPHVGPDGVYRLAPAVAVDHDRFRRLVAGSSDRDAASAVHDLRVALSLVRGRPFTTPGTEYLWAHAEALVSAMAADVADAAHQMACLCLDADELRAAWWATQQGLLASPGNGQLHRDRMVIADRRGDRAGVEAVMHELCQAIGVDDGERDEVLHPLTVDLYQRLARGRSRRTLVGGA